MEIFIIHDGQQTGPFTSDAVQTLLDEGRVRHQDMAWRKGLAAWVPLGEVIRPDSESGAGEIPSSSAADALNGANGSQPETTPATAKQRALLKFLGAEISGEVGRTEAALAISDALENPKLQGKFRKWNDEKLRLHPDVFQDEIDFRRANRVGRYLELCHTEGAEVVKDVTKAHVQVLVESLDKRFPQWEAEPHAALWDYLFPAIVEHFPQLVLPEWNGRLRLGGTSKVAAVAAAAAGTPVHRPAPRVVQLPASPPGVFGAAVRGLIYGVIVLGIIYAGHTGWKRWQARDAASAPQTSPEAPAPAKSEAAAAEPAAPAAPVVEKKSAVAGVPEIPPPAGPEPSSTPPPVPPSPAEAPAPATAPAAPMAENKPAPAEDKPAAPAAPAIPALENKPAMSDDKPPTPPAPVSDPAAAAPRTTVKLIQGIGVTLPNGNVTLPAGTQLRFISQDGPNIRVSWNNNIFDVPAVATDVGNAPASVPAVAPAATAPPAAPSEAPKNPSKPGDDL